MKQTFIQLYEKDLASVRKEITLYDDETNIWLVSEDITNSAGNIILHIVGNLKHFIGNNLAGIEYHRNREEEFSTKGLSKDNLLLQIEGADDLVRRSISDLDEENFSGKPRITFLGKNQTLTYVLSLLHGHLNYHLGQINYHRRLLDK